VIFVPYGMWFFGKINGIAKGFGPHEAFLMEIFFPLEKLYFSLTNLKLFGKALWLKSQ
jgi:hypothetical protein